MRKVLAANHKLGGREERERVERDRQGGQAEEGGRRAARAGEEEGERGPPAHSHGGAGAPGDKQARTMFGRVRFLRARHRRDHVGGLLPVPEPAEAGSWW